MASKVERQTRDAEIASRYLAGETSDALAERFGLTRRRVNQILAAELERRLGEQVEQEPMVGAIEVIESLRAVRSRVADLARRVDPDKFPAAAVGALRLEADLIERIATRFERCGLMPVEVSEAAIVHEVRWLGEGEEGEESLPADDYSHK